MMTIKHIRTELVEKPEQPLLEKIGARLLHHGLKIRIDNQFLSDCGDTWRCEITDMNNDSATKNMYGHSAPSLRSALISALQGVEHTLNDAQLYTE